MILESINAILKEIQFLNVATASKEGEPHSAPKLFFKIDGPCVYLIDHVIAKTVQNIKVNPRVSISFVDPDSLEGYRLNGAVELIESGEAHKKLTEAFNKKLIQLSAKRVIEGAITGKKHNHFELEIPEKVIVLKIKIDDMVKIGRSGDLFSEKV